MTFISDEDLVAWVTEHADVDRDTADAVLRVELEYMIATGIATKPPDFEFQFYEPRALEGVPAIVDTKRIAEDSQRLAGVDFDDACKVLEAEMEYLKFRGLA